MRAATYEMEDPRVNSDCAVTLEHVRDCGEDLVANDHVLPLPYIFLSWTR